MIVLSLEHSIKLLSVSLSNNNFLFYKEIYGNFVSSKYILKFINDLLIKNKLTYKDISILLIGIDKKKMTSMKIFFSIIQSLSILYSIPLYKVKSENSIINKLKKKYNVKYFFIEQTEHIFNLYFVYKNKSWLISKEKTFKINLMTSSNDCFFVFTKKIYIKNNIKNKLLCSKSIYLTYFFKTIQNRNKYILPNSSSITYEEIIYQTTFHEQCNTNK